MIIVDASVAFQWILPDREEVAARAVLQSEEMLIAPSILRVEVTSAISRRYREGLLSEKDAKQAISGLQSIIETGGIQLIPIEDLWELALALQFKVKHAFVDCLYLAASQSMQQPLVTADEIMAKRGKKGGVDMVLLADAIKRWPMT